MKVRTLGLLGAVAALTAVPVAADANSARDRATGGGQIIVDPNTPPDAKGAFDTIAFTAQRERGATDASGLADGQVQVNRRTTNQIKFHGIVECLIVIGGKSEGEAFISGESRDGVPFELYVFDGGKGAQERAEDLTMIWYGEEISENQPDQIQPPEDEHCGIEEDPEDVRGMARGNNQVYDASEANAANASQRSSKTSSSTSALSLAGIR